MWQSYLLCLFLISFVWIQVTISPCIKIWEPYYKEHPLPGRLGAVVSGTRFPAGPLTENTVSKSAGWGVVGPTVVPCADEQTIFAWECGENHLDKQWDPSAHEQTKPKHTMNSLSRLWASK